MGNGIFEVEGRVSLLGGASVKEWEAVRLLVMSVRSDLILVATAEAMAEEILSVTSSSRRKAAARMALAASNGILGRSEAVRRMLTIFVQV